MTALASFILTQIARQADISIEAGEAKYRAYFVNTGLYASRRDEVDAALRDAGYGAVITEVIAYG